MKTILWALLLLGPAATSLAQIPDTAPPAAADSIRVNPGDGHPDLVHMAVTDYTKLHLPPLHILLDNARERSPQVNTFAAQRDYESRELKTTRRTWMHYFKLNSSISYGTNDASSQIYYENTQAPMVQNVTGTTQRWWNIGASLNIPIDEIFNRRNKIKQQQSRIASIQYQVDSWYDNICLQIIDCYTRAVQNLAILPSASRSMVTAQAQYAATEADFINGKVDAMVLSRQKNVESDAVRQYEQTRSELNKALLELEVLSKTPIISRPEDVLGY